MTAGGITIIGASAGSGKTFRLTEEITGAVAEGLPPEGLLAVTYTRRAQAELAARMRQTLVGAGAFDEATRLPLAYLGTVHAVCMRLLREFALDAGLSPNVAVVAEDEAQLLRGALESALPAAERDRLDALATRFRLRWNALFRRHDWLGPVGDIMDLARANRIAPDALPAMATRSADGLLALLPLPLADGDALDAALAHELGRAAHALADGNDATRSTRVVVDLVTEAGRRLEDGELDWCDWAKLAGLEPAKASTSVVVALREAAGRYRAHPRLHAEIRALTVAIFDAARLGLRAYQDWKAARRVVDFVDLLDRTLDLVARPRVRAELAERLRLAVVDEFQDTSPIQLALFVALHSVAGRSVWVGDRKQCIFEYAGADPLLMDAIAGWVACSGGRRDVLGRNFRSRPELVRACSALFTPAFCRHGFVRSEVEVAPERTTPPALAALPPLGMWWLETTRIADDAEAIAEGVRRLLASPEATPVVDRATKVTRPVRPGDVAVLVATNAEAAAVAAALHARRLRVALARAGLMATPEGMLADAALRWLLDGSDSLSAATIDALTGYGGVAPEAWLAARLHGDEVEASGWRAALNQARPELGLLSPTEVLDRALAALDAVLLCARWPDPAQRVANLDALRALAARYEERCAQERAAGTVAGLLRHFDALRTETLRRDEMLASDDQHVPVDDGAVNVATYHKAKGLEWPVVVLGSLDRRERRHAFEVCPETDREGFDPEQPLAGRWIRYWPWPFGQLEKVPLGAAAEASAEGRRVAEREDKERVRLLYVGFTRARDHLVLAVRENKGRPRTGWLDALATGAGTPLVGLPVAAPDGSEAAVRLGAADVPARIWRLGAEQPAPCTAVAGKAQRWFARPPTMPGEPPGYRIAPSNAAEDWPELPSATVGAVVALPGALALEQPVTAYDVLGAAVHGFLAADVEGLAAGERLERARRTIEGARLVGTVRPDALVAASDRLRAFVAGRWPDVTWHREVPIEAYLSTPHGERRVGGAIDLVVEAAAGFVIIDHKTFPAGAPAAWRAKVRDFLPQLAAYAEALRQVGRRRILGCWIHLPIGGGMVEVRPGPAATRR